MRPSSSSRSLLVAAAASVFVAALAGPLHATAVGSLRGVVTNGTTGRRPVAALPVRLLRMSQDRASEAGAGTTNVRGEFSFSSLPSEGIYLVLVGYRGVTYTSEPVRLRPERPVSTTVMVFEPTRRRPSISMAYRLILVERIGTGMIAVRETIGVANPSASTYIGAGDGQPTFAVTAPEGAQELSALRGIAGPIIRGRLLAETGPLEPGVRQIAFTYAVPYRGTSASLRWTLEDDTSTMDVFVPDENVALSSSDFQTRPPGMIRGSRFLRLVRENSSSGQTVEVRLAGLPANYRPFTYWLAALLTLVLGASLVMVVRAGRRHVEKTGTALSEGQRSRA